jgi:hypothetical protein
MASTKRAQSGSVGTVVFAAIIVGLIWWQWDRITGLFAPGATVAEVTGFECRPESGRTTMSGNVRNLSDAPISVLAVVSVLDTSGRRYEAREAPIRPTPLPPRQSGGFRTDGPATPDGGSCKFDGLVAAEGGYPIKYRKR